MLCLDAFCALIYIQTFSFKVGPTYENIKCVPQKLVFTFQINYNI